MLAKWITVTTAGLLSLSITAAAEAQPALVYDPPTETLRVPADVPTIQQALDMIAPGGRVLIASGVYNEALTVTGKHVQLVGDGGADEVIIDATGLNSSVVHIASVSSAYHVSLLRGLTLRGGRGRLYLTERVGGGVYAAAARIVIESCIIEDNVADSGGGIYVAGRPMHIKDSIIRRNVSFVGFTCAGGGLAIHSTIGVVERTKILENEVHTTKGGGGIGVRTGQLVARHSVVAGNVAPASGAIYCYGTMELFNCTVANNVTTVATHSAMYIFSASPDPSLFTNTFVRNPESGTAGELLMNYGPDPIFTNSVMAGWTHEEDDVIAMDTRFADPAAGNYDLLPGSELIDVGSTEALLAGDHSDAVLRDRVVGLSVDIGAYEFQGASEEDPQVDPCVAADLNGDGRVDISDLLSVLSMFGMYCSDCPQDIDGSGVVDLGDLLAVMAAWGPCPE